MKGLVGRKGQQKERLIVSSVGVESVLIILCF